jgi:hypothetical protein
MAARARLWGPRSTSGGSVAHAELGLGARSRSASGLPLSRAGPSLAVAPSQVSSMSRRRWRAPPQRQLPPFLS